MLYAQDIGIIPQPNSKSDEAHWASAFVNYTMQKAGINGTNSRRSLSWLEWGIKLEKPAIGCIAVIDYGDERGHIGFVEGTYKDMIVLLGGDQMNQVNRTAFPIEDIVAFRWPIGSQFTTISYTLPEVLPTGITQSNSTIDIESNNQTNKAESITEYYSIDRNVHLLVKKVAKEQIKFRIDISGSYTRTLSGIAYEIYTEDMEIDAEDGIGYPVHEYFFWGDQNGNSGLSIRLSAKGNPRARILVWGYSSTFKIPDAIIYGE